MLCSAWQKSQCLDDRVLIAVQRCSAQQLLFSWFTATNWHIEFTLSGTAYRVQWQFILGRNLRGKTALQWVHSEASAPLVQFNILEPGKNPDYTPTFRHPWIAMKCLYVTLHTVCVSVCVCVSIRPYIFQNTSFSYCLYWVPVHSMGLLIGCAGCHACLLGINVLTWMTPL